MGYINTYDIDKNVIEVNAKPVPDLGSSLASFFVELRISNGSLIFDNNEVEYWFKKVYFQLKLEGYSITPGNRFGDNNLNENDSLSSAVKLVDEGKQRIGGNASANSNGVATHVEFENSSTKLIQRDYNEMHTQLNIKSKPNGVWEIEGSGASRRLDHRILKIDEKLCDLAVLNGANRAKIDIHVYAKKRDIDFGPIDTAKRKIFNLTNASKNHERIIELLLKRELEKVTHDTTNVNILLHKGAYEDE